MKRFVLMFIGVLFFSLCYGQKTIDTEEAKIKQTVLSFLNWYRLEQSADISRKIDSTKVYKSIVVRKEVDTMIKVSIAMKEVERYLMYLKSSNGLSNTFLNDLRQYYQLIANDVELWEPYPAKDGMFAIPGLNYDVIFGFEPEDILEHIKEGKFSRIHLLNDKAMVKFDITNINQYIFTLTKVDDKWLIDYFGPDSSNVDKM
ncbi:hypothetical protein [Pedobacter gandavensis]|uniref:hypothetical protein n=1 Tax=Pedobacter gandavensis TaxID=2679963 RepID=UPI0029311246|nr:hypothetical protein [Pedobacter gandavensis]